ncbi:MAG: endolytic transglycosylase MltG [Bacillota bacterium]|nr:endolytic transglycosylase MltG [Bacillota bacterium]MDP4170356.1 endolytic transglycosylase MltG [Bacillota bacterium]
MDSKDKDFKGMSIQERIMEQRSEARTVRRIVLIISAALLLLFAAIVIGGYFYVKSALNPVQPASKKMQQVEVPIGSSVSVIADKLEKQGVIKDASVFKYYVKLKNEGGFMAGTYQLSPSMSVPEIIKNLKTGNVMRNVTLKLTIPEGKQLKEIAAIIAKSSKLKQPEVFKVLNDKQFILSLMKKYPDLLTKDILNKKIMYPLEGYLYPATYPFYQKNPTIDEMVCAMLDKTQEVLSTYQEQMKNQKLTIHQLLTMASLVEEEATLKADRSKISSVFYNRIKKGMPLQTDPTVLYAQGKHKDRVLYADLKVKSPYNTYKNIGLPPGPISNAGNMSIQAALNPEKTNFYYFLATADGRVIFTKTLEEHNRAKAKNLSVKK